MSLLNIINRFAKFILNPQYRRQSFAVLRQNREKARLRGIPRYTVASSDIMGKTIRLVDSASFLFIYDEVFEKQIYRFKARNSAPRIIDGGANIGLSVIYFKKLYPESRITTFEPDEAVFEVLKVNLRTFGYNDVECVQKALWSSDKTLEFLHEGADGGRITRTSDKGRLGAVSATRLRSYLNEPVDFLKLDIEGAETEVLKDCADLLHNVEYLFVEYHSFINEPQTLDTLIAIMARAGFRLHIHPAITSPQPFYMRRVHFGMDIQLNIFGFRENEAH